MKQASPVPARRMLLIVAGFVVWSAAFVALYGLNAVGCAFDWPAGAQRAALLVLLAVHVGGLAALSLWTWRRWRARRADPTRPAALLEYVGVATSVAALAATIFVLAPSFALTMCM